ncbi:hypothetical protein ASG01_02135 [Chryseobacterium sp. Leaf180]|uniref:hypothetical protein n=1 Tax=Chryseobacterium sp. Leaf180 TaxID=1736289 RepID=UPI0006FE44FE|nr:hypothetical protein [Chryseobacterium sp. Leaf180]KQR94696.1 hypothetical protein ASG01_02135 [Chryseobacterium sp. Leaf180]
MKILIISFTFISAISSAQISKPLPDSSKTKSKNLSLLYNKPLLEKEEDLTLKMYKMPNVKPSDTSLYSKLYILERRIKMYDMPNTFKKNSEKKESSK